MDFLNTCDKKPTIWFRILDAIFLHQMIGSRLLTAVSYFIRIYDVRIHFRKRISFLDVLISNNDDLTLKTDVYFKETNTHQYLDYISCHPKQCKDWIPYSRAKRYRRILSNDDCFFESLRDLKQEFIDRGYPENVIKTSVEK